MQLFQCTKDLKKCLCNANTSLSCNCGVYSLHIIIIEVQTVCIVSGFVIVKAHVFLD